MSDDMGRLRNRYLYREKLEGYAAYQEIAIEWRDQDEMEDEDDMGVWRPQHRRIVMRDNLSDAEEIAILLHELGHTQDDALIPANTPEYRRIDRAYKAVYKKRATPAAREIVREREAMAWHLARGIAKRLRIPLGKWFDQAETDGMEFYLEE